MDRRMLFTRSMAFSLLGLLSACTAPMASRPAQVPVAASPPPSGPVTVGIIAINDFHGALEPPRQSVQAPDGKGGSVAVPAGGAAWLASAVDGLRGKYAHSVTVGAGDLISASQLASSIYLDEPAIGVMNRLGLDFAAVGNHEFDSGRAELLRKQGGGCARFTSRQPCQVENFTGATFRYLAASTLDEQGRTLFPATGLRSFGTGAARVTVGFVGLTLKGTSDLVSPDGIKGLTFADEADTINAQTRTLKAQGADAVVVLIHQGGRTSGEPNPDGCNALGGDIRPILDRLEPGVDVVVSGHTHWSYVCDYGTINPARPVLLTSAGVYGELVTDITLSIDPATHRVVGKRADNIIVQSVGYTSSRGPIEPTSLYPQFTPRADVSAYVQRYVDAAKAFGQRAVGSLAGPVSKGSGEGNNTGGTLGSLIADAQLAATKGASADIAFMNPFGIRAALVPAADGSLTFADIYAAQPFANSLITQTMTGAELKAVLEQGFDTNGPEQVLSPSAGFSFRFDRARAVGERIVAMVLNGQPVRPDGTYRVTTNSFLAGGGDSFTGFARQREAVVGISDLEALELWLKATPPRAVPEASRTSPITP